MRSHVTRGLPVAALAALGLPLGAPFAFAEKTPAYAITHARVMTVSGAVLENATVVFRDGVLLDVGANAVVPKDARIIDGTGLTVTPGLIDAYSGTGMPAARTGGAGGAAATQTPAANPIAPASHIHERFRPAEALRARDSGVTSVVPIPREGLVFGSASILNLVGQTTEGMVVKSNLALAGSMNNLQQRYPGSLMGVMAFYRQALSDGAWHRANVAVYEKSPSGRKRPAYDPGLEAWADVSEGKTTLLLQTTRTTDIRRAFSLADEFKGVRILLAGNTQASEEATFLKERKAAILVSVNYDPPRAGGGFFGGGGDDDRERANIEAAEKNPAALDKEGVKFALVSAFAPDFLAGVRKAVDRGLARDKALRAITLTPAEILGVADRMGSLEKGKIANVLLWSGEPLTREARVKMVFVDGQLYEPEERPASPPGGARGPGDEDRDQDGRATEVKR